MGQIPLKEATAPLMRTRLHLRLLLPEDLVLPTVLFCQDFTRLHQMTPCHF